MIHEFMTFPIAYLSIAETSEESQLDRSQVNHAVLWSLRSIFGVLRSYCSASSKIAFGEHGNVFH